MWQYALSVVELGVIKSIYLWTGMHVQVLEAMCSFLTIVASKFCVGRYFIAKYAYTCRDVLTSISQAKSK